jgi:HlyD family secretion protein
MKKAIVWIGICLAIFVGVGVVMNQNAARTKADSEKVVADYTVNRGTLKVTVVENGTIEAVKSVELKSRVTGRVAQLLVDEGDVVKAGDLIAVIDPQETQLKVQQDQAQLRGAQSQVDRASLEINQRRLTAQAAYSQAQERVKQLQLELKSQPVLTRALIAEAESAVNTAIAEKDRLVKSAQPSQRVSTETALQEAKSNYDNAVRDLNRQAELEAKGYVSKKAVEDAQLNVDNARSRRASAQESLDRLAAAQVVELKKADEQIAQARASLSRAKANAIQDRTKQMEFRSALDALASAKANLQDPAILAKGRDQNQASIDQLRSILSDSERQLRETEIRAPFGGIVTKKGIEIGELATGLSSFSSGSTIVKIEDRTTMRVTLNMNEIDVARIKNSMPAVVEVDALPTEKFSGKVQKISPASNEVAAGGTDAVVRYKVEILLDAGSPTLRSGMSAKCKLDVINRKDVVLVPLDYLTKKGEDSFITLLNPDAKAKEKTIERKVVLGAQSGSQAEVVSGLKEGEKIVKPTFDGPKRKGFMGGPEDGGS